MYEICVRKRFYARHNLIYRDGYEDEVHNHKWVVEVYVRNAELNSDGLVLDFKYMDKLLAKIVSKFKNKYLNELEQFQGINPSAENICRWIYEEMKKSIPCDLKISRVVLWETPRYCAIYSDGMEQE